jgi:hypothetical protein
MRTPWRREQKGEPSTRFENVEAEKAAQGLGYALFTEFSGGLSAATIDISTGKLLSHRDVSGPAANWYSLYFGESTRILPWDAQSARFVFADADLSTGEMTVYTIDPATGQSTAQTVSGCSGSPVGLAWDADVGALVVSTHTATEASFFAVNPDTGAAQPMGRVQRGDDEFGSDGYYAAYMSHAHAGVAFRTGLKEVYAYGHEGLGVTQLPGTGDEGSSVWQEPTRADGHGLPVSMQQHPSGGYLSLAARNNGMLDMVSWTPNGSAKVLAQLQNAQLPQTPGSGPLGYVTDAPVVGDTYASMTVSIAPGTMGIGDKWTLSTLSLSSGELNEFALTPQPAALGAEVTSLSGFGLPAKQRSVSV